MSTENSHEQVRKQIEFYFSDANLWRDTFMKEKIAENREGYVPISCLLTFKKLASLTTDAQVVAAAMKDSLSLEVHPDGLSVKRVNPYDDAIDHSQRVSVVYPIPGDATEEVIRGVIEKFCPESHIAAIWRKRKKHPTSKLSMHIAEIHWEKEADVPLLLEKSENGKLIVFPASEHFDNSDITAMTRDAFEALFAKNGGKDKVEYEGSDYTTSDLKNRVIDLSADSPIGAPKHVKRIPSESLRGSIMYAHVLDGEPNRMLVLCDSEESCTKVLAEYDGAPTIPQESTDEKKEAKESKIKATIAEAENVLNTVLLGFKEFKKTLASGRKSFGGHKRKFRNTGKKKWQKR